MANRRKIVLVLGKQPEDGHLSWEAVHQVIKAEELLRTDRWRGATLVIAGGMTVPGFPFSESEVFLSKFKEEFRIGAILEKQSTTTPENIKFVREELETRGIEVVEMVVVSTWAHCFEVYFSTIRNFWPEVKNKTHYAPSPSGSWRGSRDHLGAALMRRIDPSDRYLVPWFKRKLEGGN